MALTTMGEITRKSEIIWMAMTMISAITYIHNHRWHTVQIVREGRIVEAKVEHIHPNHTFVNNLLCYYMTLLIECHLRHCHPAISDIFTCYIKSFDIFAPSSLCCQVDGKKSRREALPGTGNVLRRTSYFLAGN